MPRAGWCRECEEWVWVDEAGGCVNGHPASSVDAVHEATPQAPGPVLGDGEMPRELDRFNWGAFLLPGIWGIFHGAWPLVWVWLFGVSTSFLFASAVPVEGPEVLSGLILSATLISLVEAIVRLWAGIRANRVVWIRQSRAINAPGSAAPRIPIARFVTGQRLWTIVGGAALLASMPLVYVSWNEQEAGAVGVGMGVAWLVAELGAASWLASRMRHSEPPTA